MINIGASSVFFFKIKDSNFKYGAELFFSVTISLIWLPTVAEVDHSTGRIALSDGLKHPRLGTFVAYLHGPVTPGPRQPSRVGHARSGLEPPTRNAGRAAGPVEAWISLRF